MEMKWKLMEWKCNGNEDGGKMVMEMVMVMEIGDGMEMRI